MPYPPRALYNLVADIDSYRLYLPYCLDSRITARCPATSAPTEADLRIAWGSFDETFRSRVTCCDPTATSTAAPATPTTTSGDEVMAVEADASGGGSSGGGGLFQLLKARWEISPATAITGANATITTTTATTTTTTTTTTAPTTRDDSSQVRLHVEYLFANPLYNAFSGAFAPKLADLMVDAFVKRAQEVLGDDKPS